MFMGVQVNSVIQIKGLPLMEAEGESDVELGEGGVFPECD